MCPTWLCSKTMVSWYVLYIKVSGTVIYSIHTCIMFTSGIDKEEESDMLRSILAQFDYCHQVCSWDRKGVPFKIHMYVPEIHPITKEEYHEREDDAHVLKVCVYTALCIMI